jgi:hypothetical protein
MAARIDEHAVLRNATLLEKTIHSPSSAWNVGRLVKDFISEPGQKNNGPPGACPIENFQPDILVNIYELDVVWAKAGTIATITSMLAMLQERRVNIDFSIA